MSSPSEKPKRRKMKLRKQIPKPKVKREFKVGELKAGEKVFIVENYKVITIEEMSQKLKRTTVVIKNYLKKVNLLKVKPKEVVETKPVENFQIEPRIDNQYGIQVGPATVFTGENIPFVSSPNKNPFKY